MNKAYARPYIQLVLCSHVRNIGFDYCQDVMFSLLNLLLYAHAASRLIYI